jgi:TatA/E family protein of Tat protein translocase
VGSLGFAEILFILVLALLIFGPKRLPEVGRTLGRALGEFRRATSDLRRSIETEMAVEDEPPRPRPTPPPAPRDDTPPG